MSSLPRRMQRNFQRKQPDYEPKPQYTKTDDDGGYMTLTPTKGWRTFTARRLAAGRAMAALLDHVLPRRRRKPAKMYRRPAPAAPSTETRQQRRAAQRGYRL